MAGLCGVGINKNNPSMFYDLNYGKIILFRNDLWPPNVLLWCGLDILEWGNRVCHGKRGYSLQLLNEYLHVGEAEWKDSVCDKNCNNVRMF